MPVRVEEYAGFVFINLNPDAQGVEAQLPGLEASLRKACPVIDDLKLAARFVTEVDLPSVGVNADIGNLIRLHRPVEKWADLMAKLAPLCRSLS